MPPFVRRTILGDIPNNPYYNERKYCGTTGYYKGNKHYQCVNGCVARSSEIAETNMLNLKKTDTLPEIKVDNPMFTRYGYGNAIEWWNTITWDRTTKADEVRLGDVVMYGKGYGWDKATQKYCGHVRVIEAIEDDCFICSGANEDGKGNFLFNVKIPKQDGSGDMLEGLIGYAHNPYITNSEKPKVDYKKLYLEAQAKLDKIKGIL